MFFHYSCRFRLDFQYLFQPMSEHGDTLFHKDSSMILVLFRKIFGPTISSLPTFHPQILGAHSLFYLQLRKSYFAFWSAIFSSFLKFSFFFISLAFGYTPTSLHMCPGSVAVYYLLSFLSSTFLISISIIHRLHRLQGFLFSSFA